MWGIHHSNQNVCLQVTAVAITLYTHPALSTSSLEHDELMSGIGQTKRACGVWNM